MKNTNEVNEEHNANKCKQQNARVLDEYLNSNPTTAAALCVPFKHACLFPIRFLYHLTRATGAKVLTTNMPL